MSVVTSGSAPQELMAAWRDSDRSRAFAHRCVTLIIIGVVAVHIGFMWVAVHDFYRLKTPEFAAEVSVQMAEISPMFVDELRGMVNRLYPRYVSVFEQMFERDYVVLRDTAKAEMRLLDEYAQKRWPDIENGIHDIVITAEEVALEEMGRFVTAPEAEEISAAYGAALQKKYDDVLTVRLRQHVALCEEIGANLEKLSATEPDIQPPIKLRSALGMMLELMGIELQLGLE